MLDRATFTNIKSTCCKTRFTINIILYTYVQVSLLTVYRVWALAVRVAVLLLCCTCLWQHGALWHEHGLTMGIYIHTSQCCESDPKFSRRNFTLVMCENHPVRLNVSTHITCVLRSHRQIHSTLTYHRHIKWCRVGAASPPPYARDSWLTSPVHTLCTWSLDVQTQILWKNMFVFLNLLHLHVNTNILEDEICRRLNISQHGCMALNIMLMNFYSYSYRREGEWKRPNFSYPFTFCYKETWSWIHVPYRMHTYYTHTYEHGSQHTNKTRRGAFTNTSQWNVLSHMAAQHVVWKYPEIFPSFLYIKNPGKSVTM